MKRILALIPICFITSADAEPIGRCVVTDPTGTPLNVRSSPNGPIQGALHNGTIVRQEQTVQDQKGKSWSYVVPTEEGKPGWVYRQYVSCY